VKPPALVTTAVPLMVAVFSAVADDAWPAEVLAGLLELDDELPHAAVTSTVAVSRPAASHLLRIGRSPFSRGEKII
jgi:hypothetical protein